jgi:VWFA-related protein
MTAVVAFVCLLAEQEAPPVFKVETRLVNVTFSVTGPDGNPLPDLRRDEVEVYEDGKPQPIRHFSREADAPLSLGIVVDLSGSQKGILRKNRLAALQFLRQTLTPDDSVFVVTFGEGMRLVQEQTSSLAEIEATFRQWDDSFEDSPVWSKRIGSPVYTSLLQSARRKLIQRTGRKALLMISDGLDTRSRDSVTDVIEYLQTADTVVYWMKTPNMLAPQGAGLGRALQRLSDKRKEGGMRKIADETGGRVFEEESWEEQFRRIELELRTQYSLAFVPTREPDGKTHKLQIRVQRDRVRLRHKPAYRDEVFEVAPAAAGAGR